MGSGLGPIKIHGMLGCKLTMRLVLNVRARKMGQRQNLVARFENGK